jgi:hypothetical protein
MVTRIFRLYLTGVHPNLPGHHALSLCWRACGGHHGGSARWVHGGTDATAVTAWLLGLLRQAGWGLQNPQRRRQFIIFFVILPLIDFSNSPAVLLLDLAFTQPGCTPPIIV